jgi:hypothetical protein
MALLVFGYVAAFLTVGETGGHKYSFDEIGAGMG